MRHLLIIAHPKSNSLSHQFALSYQKKFSSRNCQIIDLYKDKPLPFLDFNSSQATKKQIQTYQEQITNSNHLVFFHPMWWGMPPAILKNFLDHTISSRFAFQFVNGKKVGLLKGKSSSVYITAGGPWYYYIWPFMPHLLIWRHFILEYCGLAVNTIKIFSSLDMGDKLKNREQALVSFQKHIRG